MITAIILLMVLALFHFIYESILAPDLRLWLTWRLYALRNELSVVEVKCVHTPTELHCLLLRESINALISVVHRISVASLFSAEFESRKEPDFLARAKERARMLDECTVPQIREIRRRTLDLAAKALAVNSIGWAALLVAPWVLASVGISAAQRRLRVLITLDSHELQRISHVESATMAPICQPGP